MNNLLKQIQKEKPTNRSAFIIQSFVDNYSNLIANDPAAWRGKFRKMAETPFAFYRGAAGLYYADMIRDTEDPFLDERTSRIWIQGDLHAENFGTYMNGAGQFVFDVNDFDEAYVAPFTWDVKRFATSLVLIGFQKALSDAEIREFVSEGARSYARQVARFANGADKNFSLRLDTATGTVLNILYTARQMTRIGLLGYDTEVREGERHFKVNKNIQALDTPTKTKMTGAVQSYLDSIPKRKRRDTMVYNIKDIVRRKGLGIGSSGLEMYSVLLEGENEALENDIIISMKVSQPSAAARYVNDNKIQSYFKNDGHRTAVSQRALQAHADPFLGHSTCDGKGMYVSEVSPYTADMDWGAVNDMDDLLEVVTSLGQCIAKIHCCSDDDSDQTLVTYSADEAINKVIDGRESDFVNYIADFAIQYAEIVRNDHRLFVDAFRNRQILGV